MDLNQALKATHNHPPADERIAMLRDQLARFRREFYGHVTDLHRYAAYEAANGSLPSAEEAAAHATAVAGEYGQHSPQAQAASNVMTLVAAKQRAEEALDTIDGAITATLEQLRALEPDER